MRHITWPGAALAALVATAALGGMAQAAQSGWQCSAAAVSTSLAGNPLVNPVTSSADPCVSNSPGLDNLPTPLGLRTLLGRWASTDRPEGRPEIDSQADCVGSQLERPSNKLEPP